MTDPARRILATARARHLMESGQARATREAANLSQREMAQAVGVSVATISRWEGGAVHAAPDKLARYAEILDALTDVGVPA